MEVNNSQDLLVAVQGSGEPIVKFLSKDQKVQDLERVNVSVQAQRQKKKLMSQLKGSQAEGTFIQPLCSIQTLN